jgi:hypothetical protein
VTRPDDRWHFRHHGPGVYILCRSCSARRGDILFLADGRLHVFLTDCLTHGQLDLDPREQSLAVAKAQRLGRMVPLRATPIR